MGSSGQQEIPPLAEKVLAKMAELGLDQKQLAERAGVPRSSVNRLVRGSKQISTKTVDRVLDFLGLLVRAVGEEKRYPRLVPVISWVQAGQWAEAIDPYPAGVSGEADAVYAGGPVSRKAFALRVEGDSMSPDFPDGSTIIVDPELTCESGQPCVVRLDDEVTFKKVLYKDDAVWLVPLNPRYKKWVIDPETDIDFQVVGRVIEVTRRL